MKQFQNKKKLRGTIYSKIMIIVLLLVAFLLIKAVFNIYLKEVESRKMSNLSKEKLLELKDREKRLATQTEALSTDQGKEEEIRSKLSVVRPGEEVIVIVTPMDLNPLPSPKLSWWETLILKIKGF